MEILKDLLQKKRFIEKLKKIFYDKKSNMVDKMHWQLRY